MPPSSSSLVGVLAWTYVDPWYRNLQKFYFKKLPEFLELPIFAKETITLVKLASFTLSPHPNSSETQKGGLENKNKPWIKKV